MSVRFPEAVVCSDKSLFVAGGREVCEYTKQGRQLRRFAPFADVKALGLFGQTLYVADSENGTLCSIDLVSEKRCVLVEGLHSPSAVTINERVIAVAEAGAHRIAMFDHESLKLLRRFEVSADGLGEAAQLNQPMDMALCDDGTLWFVDAESSSLHYIDGNKVATAVGEGLYTFGDSDNEPMLLQHPQGVACGHIGDGCGGGRVFVADTCNGKIKAFDPISGRMMTVAKGLHEPVGICKSGCRIYVAERAAHRVVRLDLSSMRSETIIS